MSVQIPELQFLRSQMFFHLQAWIFSSKAVSCHIFVQHPLLFSLPPPNLQTHPFSGLDLLYNPPVPWL